MVAWTPNGGGRASRPATARDVYFGAAHGVCRTPVIDRAHLDRTARQGPFIVEEYEGTSVVPPDCTARLDAAGNIIIALP
jgi:N-methylhydantoinase A